MASSSERSATSIGERLTRQVVADRLQMSVSSIRRLEGTRLHPEQDEQGVWRFDAAEVEQLVRSGSVRRRAPNSRRRDTGRRDLAGEAAAKVFRMFSDGRSLREIVVSARQPPERVRALYREWLVGLREGEQLRLQHELEARERRERAEDERAHRELMQAFRS